MVACTAIVGLVSADRLTHSGTAIAPRAAVPEPSATGSIPMPEPVAAAKPAKAGKPAIPNGFDTERLHALMRGDPILPSR